MVKRIIIGNKGQYVGMFKGSDTWHRIRARSEAEAKGKMMKGSKYIYSEIIIKKYKRDKLPVNMKALS